jgi:hypothetical protein
VLRKKGVDNVFGSRYHVTPREIQHAPAQRRQAVVSAGVPLLSGWARVRSLSPDFHTQPQVGIGEVDTTNQAVPVEDPPLTLELGQATSAR